METLKKLGILPWVILAIILGIVCGMFFPEGLSRVFYTFNDVFALFLNFCIPLIIVGLIVPAIGDLGRGAGYWLFLTAVIAYASTLFSGFLTLFVCNALYDKVLDPNAFAGLGASTGSAEAAQDTFSTTPGYLPTEVLQMPPVFSVMTALILSFIMGIGLALVPRGVLRRGFLEFKEIINALISKIIIPLLPLHIFGIFLNLTASGAAFNVMRVLLIVVVIVLALEVVILLAQFIVAGVVDRKNPFRALWNMKDAYLTALGTSSSAATIPVTLRQTLKNGVREPIASFVVPLCATIHLSGSTSKITAFAMAIAFTQGMPITTGQWIAFICMLGIIMIAAPGVPGGAIMASIGIITSMLGFNDAQVGLMIATYIALDSFGTATNVTGDGAIAMIMDRIAGKKIDEREKQESPIGQYEPFDPDAYLAEVKAQ
ncbi:Na+/H+-dicarboxylate symporter [Actinobaculum suis]|uniref:C4-dicarboxylate transport protein n=1 Tax=Actinobaculum suis TaxID=1657 RepID=A0A0K9EVN6_9ACTO|nr:dicarboxylate/amino acid:cation symporter [Actinobaculum suis]KMY23942.1 sodium:proton antiporter [Actinobaculum suis]MDY5153394.1 dicarboxylate/amino acid:cation symporter [Actinobaculum suis]OCA93366.1 sodium:proton antiporter [Actinobaculum suis]OCA94287.1 sodium:proton antiporter [Actinobaculum suis]SDE16859.1 Na+/H+-dicarboxylate symporter [Actinobaculum suis]